MSKKWQTEVLVVGGGIIGCSTALELAKHKIKVLVIDKGEVGHGSSYGNAGWVTPCFAMPLPMPGLFLKSMKWLRDPEGPLYIQPRLSLQLATWLTQFVSHMKPSHRDAVVPTLVEMSQWSLDFYSKIEKTHPFGFEQKGLLFAAQTDDGMKTALDEMNLVANYGVPGEKLTETELKKFEPALQGSLRGGVYFPKEAHLEPYEVVKALRKLCEQNGVEFLEQAELISFKTAGHRVTEVLTTQGVIKADSVVIASGSWSRELVKKLGLKIPLLSGKGYAIITDPIEKMPAHPIMLVERKIAITPRKNSLRIAGTLELIVEPDSAFNTRRLNAIWKGAQTFLTLDDSTAWNHVWNGLRPCTSDGVPVISEAPGYDNLVLCFGHQMLGVQSGPASGALASDIVRKVQPRFATTIFEAKRF